MRSCKIVGANGFHSIKNNKRMATLFEPTHLVQTFVLALSLFNVITFLWLTFTVWLNGDRKSKIARVGVAGLGLSALFFYLHALLISEPLAQTSGVVTQDVLWHLIWLPALGVPYIWFVIGLHYASLINDGWRRRRPALLLLSALLGAGVLAFLIANHSLFTFVGTIRLLAYGDVLSTHTVSLFSPPVLLPVLFLCYVTFCAIGPWFTPGRVLRLIHVLLRLLFRGDTMTTAGARGMHLSLRKRLSDAFWDDKVPADQLAEPVLSWHLARPGLLLAALLMVALTAFLGGLGVWSMMHWFASGGYRNVQGANLPSPTMIPLSLLLIDACATGAVACIILLIGYSVVRHGILIERPLPRNGFFEQWRGIVIMATTIAILIVLLVNVTQSDLAGLLLITSLATCAYALFTWSSYSAHDRYVSLLGPFLRSANMHHWLHTDMQKTEQSMEALFFHLCHDVLEVQCARLVVFTGSVQRSFSYRWPGEESEERDIRAFQQVGEQEDTQTQPFVSPLPVYEKESYEPYLPKRVHVMVRGQPMLCWIVPIQDELGIVAQLSLGPRHDRSVFTDEDMDLARACGQRILDTLRDHEAMQAVAGLLRRRIVDVKLLGAQHRRILHDEILPQMHLALLRLETVRSSLVRSSPPTRATGAVETLSRTEATTSQHEALEDAILTISDAHRRLAAMMRSTTPSAPHRLERDGMLHAIHAMLRQDFQQAFDEVKWTIPEEVMSRIDETVPPALAELVFAAVQETFRNAARHGRGSDLHRHLCLTVTASCSPHLELLVSDDGVGIGMASSTTTGTGGGLLTHSALLAIAGGSLTVKSTPESGVTVRIFLPAEALR